MKKILAVLSTVAFTVLVLTGCPGSKGGSDAVDLRLNLEKGKTYSYTMKTNMTMDMEMMGKPMNTTADIDFGFKMKVNDIDTGGNRVIAATYDVIRFKMNAMGMDMGYDSKNVGDTSKENLMNGMFRKIFGSMLGKTFNITLSQKGEVIKVEGLKELVESMANSIDVPENMKEQMHQQLANSFNDEQIKQSFTQGFGVYPDKPVKLGDSWTRTMDKDLNNMKMKMDVKYTVKEINSNSVILDLAGTIKGLENQDSSKAVKLEINGDQKGTMEIIRSSGLSKSGKIEMNMKMNAMGNPINMKANILLEGKEE